MIGLEESAMALNGEGTVEPIRESVRVPVDVERAFGLFVERLNEWWPAEYTWAGEVLEKIVIEEGVGGRCYEQGPHGFECDWGRVLAWEAPRRLLFTWQIAPDRVPQPDPEQASEVEVRFAEAEEGETEVTLVHRNFERHGEGAAEYRAALGSEQGWAYILSPYVALAQSQTA
jgi:uncharacterized protein YndB with AHSA1/START domain